MNKRLIWNFEINSESSLQIPSDEGPPLAMDHWEFRCFWSENDIIVLNGLSKDFLSLATFQIKHREDRYVLLPDIDLNLKFRHHHLQYKPMMNQKMIADAYGKKITLSEDKACSKLPGNIPYDSVNLLAHIQQKGQFIDVTKDILSHRFKSKTKLELARLIIGDNIYFSVCIESRSLNLITAFVKQLLGDASNTNYVTFLKQNLHWNVS